MCTFLPREPIWEQEQVPLVLRQVLGGLLPRPIVLNGDALPWVETATHLGHELHQQCNMEYDAKCKRASYIDKTTTIRETFDFARPNQKRSAISIYTGGIYGFAMWDLYGQRAESAFKCWDTADQLSSDYVPRSCHRWLVESLLSGGLPSSRQRHLDMYAGFYHRLHTSSVPEVREMAYYCLADMRLSSLRISYKFAASAAQAALIPNHGAWPCGTAPSGR